MEGRFVIFGIVSGNLYVYYSKASMYETHNAWLYFTVMKQKWSLRPPLKRTITAASVYSEIFSPRQPPRVACN